MQSLTKLSSEQLFQPANEQASQLDKRSDELAAQSKEVVRRDDVIKQLEAKLKELEKD